MDEMTVFERRLMAALERQAGPPRPVDATAIVDAVTHDSPGSATTLWLPRSTRLLAFAVLVGLTLAAVGGALLLTGSSSPPLITMPASIAVPAPTCPEARSPAPDSGALPISGPPPLSRPHNGLLAAWDPNVGIRLLDPSTGDELATWSGVSTSADGWSPDGRWLAAHSPARQPPDMRTGCQDVELIAADGRRVVPLIRNPVGDETRAFSWSPDAAWLAVATNGLVTNADNDLAGSAIDVLAIEPDGAVAERRRVWSSDAEGVADLAWGPDGTLAWTADTLYLLRPGATEPTTIALSEGIFPMRWSADAAAIVATGFDGLHVISVPEARDRIIGPAVTPRTGIEVWEDTVAVSSAGRVYIPAHTQLNGVPQQTLVNVGLDGSDPVALTDLSASVHPGPTPSGPVLSPDGALVAFRGNDDLAGGIWVVASDWTELRQLSSLSGILSWQPVP